MSAQRRGEQWEGAVVPEGSGLPEGGSDWRARLETSCDNSDLSEMEQQVIE